VKKLTAADSLVTINHYKNILESEGIACQIRNEHLGAIMGEMPFVEVWPQLWVKNDLDYDRALQLIGEANSDESPLELRHQPLAAGRRHQRAWSRVYGMLVARSRVPAISLRNIADTFSGCIGLLIRNPWARSHLQLLRNSSCDSVSTPLRHCNRGANDALMAVVFFDVCDQRLVEHKTVDETVVE
jgi:hypothetical protein